MAVQGGLDLYNWNLSSFGTYANSTISGAVGGWATLYGGPVGGGAAGGATHATIDGWLNGGVTVGGVAKGTVIGAAGGKIGQKVVSKIGPLFYRSAEAAANGALKAGKTSGAAAELRIGDRIFTGRSGEVVPMNDKVLGALMGAPKSSHGVEWHGGCAEISCLNKALNAGVDPRGGSMRAVNISDSGARHGTPKPFCASCVDILDFFGVK